MTEPTDVDQYYILVTAGEQDGKRGKFKIKKWFINGKDYERILSFKPYPWEEKDESTGSV